LLLVGLTGGIGAGKSTVARLLESKGAVVVDTDDLARQVTRLGTPTHAAILDRFGGEIEGPDGEIDRARLADVVFSDPAALADLNALVHPAVEAAVGRRLVELPSAGVVVLDVPLLVEVGWDARCDVVVVVDAPEDVAVRRLVGQRDVAEADVRRRIASQASRAERLARADVVIANDGSLDDLARRVDEAWAELTSR
jgi:dephospho-CoA kinase